MNIVHATLTNSRRTGILGSERHILSLAGAQRAGGAAVTVIVDEGNGFFVEACRQQGLQVVAVPGLNQDALLAELGQLAPEVIHCHVVRAAMRVIPVGNQLGVPCVLTLHTNGIIENDATVMGHFSKARESGLRFATIAVSKALRDGARELGIAGDHYYVPNGTEPHDAVSIAAPPNFISVGTLSNLKAVDVAILAMAELKQRRGPLGCPGLNVYGAGSELEYLQEMVAVLSLAGSVRFHGFQLDVLGRCPATDILLVSSRSETGPLVVLEAMSRGMPVIATAVGDVPQVLPDKRYGRVVAPGSILALADAMESLLEQLAAGQFDPKAPIERHRSRYTVQIMADRVREVYEQEAARGGAR